jgi:hypothetical protein
MLLCQPEGPGGHICPIRYPSSAHRLLDMMLGRVRGPVVLCALALAGCT